MNRQLFFSLLVLFFLFLGTTVAVLYGRGYRFGFESGRPDLAGTGILVATSNPNGASVYINGHLSTATDNTINLPPGAYDVKIQKEGYLNWEKKILVQKEAVSKAEALLFPNAPKLESVTSLGAGNPVIDPSLSKIAYMVSSQSAKKNGIYVLDTSGRPILTLQSSSVQIADDTADFFSTASVAWSPDGSKILAKVGKTYYLLSANSFNDTPQDVTETLSSVVASWTKDKADKDKARLDSLKPGFSALIQEDMTVVDWSPDDTKLLYIASKSASLPFVIVPRLIGTNSTSEERNIKEGQVYLYDLSEDHNYHLAIDPAILKSLGNITSSLWNPVSWLADSKHFLYVHDKQIDIMEYDGKNQTTIYAGPFIDDSVFPSQTVSKIIVLTNLGNSAIVPNLYDLDLK